MSLSVFIAVGLLALPSAQQSSASPGADAPVKPQVTAPAPALNPDELPVSLKRIQRALARPPSIRIRQLEGRDGRPLYRVDVEAEKIDIQRILGDDFVRGPVSYGGMTHQEFLDLVTPDYAKGYAAFSNTQGLVVAATSIALKWAVLKAIDKFKDARDTRAQEEAKKEVREALEALRQARRAAGLPDK
jgi:hypothetical protein